MSVSNGRIISYAGEPRPADGIWGTQDLALELPGLGLPKPRGKRRDYLARRRDVIAAREEQAFQKEVREVGYEVTNARTLKALGRLTQRTPKTPESAPESVRGAQVGPVALEGAGGGTGSTPEQLPAELEAVGMEAVDLMTVTDDTPRL